MIMLLQSLIISVLTGFFLISLCWPSEMTGIRNLVLKGSLAVGIGFGFSSCAFFVWLSLVGPMRGLFVMTELLLLAVLGAAWFYRTKQQVCRSAIPAELDSESIAKFGILRILSTGFYFALGCSLVTFVILSLQNPHGAWDAWTIWNLRARFLFRGAQYWNDASLVYWFKPDYPLLVPATIARSWMYIGNDTVVVPIIVALLFTFATIILTFSSVSIFRGNTQAFLGGLLLLGTPFFISHGASQYADVPLGFYFVATISLLALNGRAGDGHLLTLAGLTAGYSAWTKNEGLLFVVAVIAAFIVSILSRREWGSSLTDLLSFLAGLLPVLAVVAYFKIDFAPTNDLVQGQSLHDTLARVMDLSRYTAILEAFGRGFFYFGNWSHALSIPTLLACYILLLGVYAGEQERPGIVMGALTLGFVLAGYF